MPKLTCKFCSRSWTYKGKSKRATCPNPKCKRKIPVNPVYASAISISGTHDNKKAQVQPEMAVHSNPPMGDNVVSRQTAPKEPAWIAPPVQHDKVGVIAGQMDIERLIATSPNPEAAVNAAMKVELGKEALKIINDLNLGKMTTKEKIEFYNAMGWKDEANKLELDELNNQIDELMFLFFSIGYFRHSGGWVEPIFEESLRFGLSDLLKKKQLLEVTISAVR